MSKPRSGTLLTNPDANASAVASTTISLEYASLKYQNHCPLGMYIVPSKESLFAWDAMFFVHQGYYADAIFKFRLLFPHEYPDRPPVVQFLTDMFHPLVSNKGIFNLQPRFHPWRPKEHHIFDVLHFIKSAFKKSVLDKILEVDCMNKESHRLCVTSVSSFYHPHLISTDITKPLAPLHP
ncbi:UBC-like protein [Cylindrobasidium torrendii FP15055 ss-10]|uniref:UBC-like protein n=1 Tax=Cylindrobasidium torrendii FP15055 ss-10 TaxID=1314674 RepID=A0A0D7BMJ4_9AGAR|nr:UBC-like protein [Cylindrobasidium torrendii FP15055 ss-10]